MVEYKLELLTDKNKLVWDAFCLSCANAWYWHTTAFQEFVMSWHAIETPEIGISGEIINKSFIVYKNDAIAAIVPILIYEMERIKNVFKKEMVYYGWATPYPALKVDLSEKEREELTKYIFDNIEIIVKEQGVCRAVFSIFYQQEKVFAECMKRNVLLDRPGFLDISEHTQTLDLMGTIEEIESGFRKRYMRYIRANKDKFDIEIITGKNITQAHREECLSVIKKDTAPEWPEKEIPFMHSTILAGHAVFVRCSLKEGKLPAGYLYVALYKEFAFDFAVAVDNEYKDLRVSQALKVSAARYLKSKNIKSYELGIFTQWSNAHRIASEKQRAITYFKRGFANNLLPMFIAEKYYDREYLKLLSDYRLEMLEKDLFLQGGPPHEKI